MASLWGFMGRVRTLLVLGALVGLLLAPTAAATVLRPPERSLLEQINRVRRAHGLAPLRVDRALQRAARAHSRDMIRRGYFKHGAVRARLRHYGARGRYLAENLAWGVGPMARARIVVRRWLASPGHRANLLRPGFRRIGVASVTGSFAGRRRARVVTADFAGR